MHKPYLFPLLFSFYISPLLIFLLPHLLSTLFSFSLPLPFPFPLPFPSHTTTGSELSQIPHIMSHLDPPTAQNPTLPKLDTSLDDREFAQLPMHNLIADVEAAHLERQAGVDAPTDHWRATAQAFEIAGQIWLRDPTVVGASCFENHLDSTDTFCVPGVIVVGGTRILDGILTGEGVVQFAGGDCMEEGGGVDGFWEWVRNAEKGDFEAGRFVTGCEHLLKEVGVLRELVRVGGDVRVVIVVRNYADWVWGKWKGDAEGFDEVVRSGDLKELRLPLAGWRWWIEGVVEIMDAGVWVVQGGQVGPAEVAEFVGVEPGGVEEKEYKEEEEERMGGGMWESTRQFIDRHWRPECEWFRETFDLYFEEVC